MSTKEIELKKEVEKLESYLQTTWDNYLGNIEDFSSFLHFAIIRELHAMTTEEYKGRKPNFEEFEKLQFNIDVLFNDLENMAKIQMLNAKLEIEFGVG